ncbi:hypothetical protein ACFO3J_01490 [Streptomyces polygonati]|uniref:Uncharacterized protein n=1 Tax=Streptomyces polygonati TaxID=1617087 RepID=A0ABV8HFB7_9ACTN
MRYTSGGSASKGNTQPIASSDADFKPPVCWYKSFTPAQFEAELQRRYYAAGNDHADTIYNYYYGIRSQMEGIKYHQGDEGSWWVLEYNDSYMNDPTAVCPYQQGWMWQGPGDPAPPAPITPEMLAQAAYKELKLPVPAVKLSPAAQNQKVNLATYVSFGDALGYASLTANLENVWATVVAVPSSLHIDAGTSYASPESCDYVFTPTAGGYSVNSSDASCNITYRKATAVGSTYRMQAQMTWTVTWTPTQAAEPGRGQGLAPGYSTSPQPVTVQEIQTVNR